MKHPSKKSAEASSNKLDFKDKYDNGEMDLSMSDLQEVPVKNIVKVAYQKTFSLDLSSNHITVLSKSFVTLTNLVKLDLSKNQLRELPENFGELGKLKHLDLYKNQLQNLPLSFSKLKALKWLDLKDNPLMPKIAQIAGPCLDTKQCQLCARDIVQFYTKLEQQIQQEKEMREMHRQKDLQNKEANAQKQKQKDKKNKKKQKIEQKVEHIRNKNNLNGVSKKTEFDKKQDKQKTRGINKFLKFFIYIFTLTIFLSMVLFVATSIDLSYTRDVKKYVVDSWKTTVNSLSSHNQAIAIQIEQYVSGIHSTVGRELEKLLKNYVKE